MTVKDKALTDIAEKLFAEEPVRPIWVDANALIKALRSAYEAGKKSK